MSYLLSLLDCLLETQHHFPYSVFFPKLQELKALSQNHCTQVPG